jgi:cobalt-zinc-cadmium resistance protein CzcA
MVLIFSASAQSPRYRCEELIRLALDSNLTLRSSGMDVSLQRALKGASTDIGKTTVEGQYGQFNSAVRDNGLTVSQSIAFPTVYANQRRLADNKIKSSQWQLKASQLEIATQVKQLYWQLAYLHAVQTQLREQSTLFEGFLQAAEARTRAGETGSLEKMTARSQVMEIKNQARQNLGDIAVCTSKLQTLLNTTQALNIADTVLTRLPFEPSAEAVAQHPALAQVRQEVDVAHTEKQLERSRMLPDLSIGTASGASAALALTAGVVQACAGQSRFSHVLNGRFKGGHITRHYGQPGQGVHAVQLEMTQCSYMQECLPFDYLPERAVQVQPHLQRMLAAALDFVR